MPRLPLDEWLVLRCRQGDDEAFARLVDRWQPRLRRQARRLAADDEAVADALQETWLAIVRGIGSLDDPATFPVWALRIVTRRCADQVRRRERQRRAEAAVERPVAGDALARVEAGDEIAAALAALAPDRRALLELRYLEELPLAEIAAVLEVPEGTVKSRLFQARSELRAVLGRPEGNQE